MLPFNDPGPSLVLDAEQYAKGYLVQHHGSLNPETRPCPRARSGSVSIGARVASSGLRATGARLSFSASLLGIVSQTLKGVAHSMKREQDLGILDIDTAIALFSTQEALDVLEELHTRRRLMTGPIIIEAEETTETYLQDALHRIAKLEQALAMDRNTIERRSKQRDDARDAVVRLRGHLDYIARLTDGYGTENPVLEAVNLSAVEALRERDA